jgi:transcriptional regulator with XRE-family HTH domain
MDALRLTNRVLAARLGISQGWISRVSSGTSSPGSDLREEVAAAPGVTVDELFIRHYRRPRRERRLPSTRIRPRARKTVPTDRMYPETPQPRKRSAEPIERMPHRRGVCPVGRCASGYDGL